MTSHPVIRDLRADDIIAVARVLARAYPGNPDFTQRLRLYLALQRVRTFVAVENDEPVGIVIGNDYGPCVYVSLMGVDPQRQRRGIASALMTELLAWTDARRAWAELDATDAGAPLYRAFGFRDDGETQVYDGHGGGRMPSGIARATAADLDALCELDREAFGADRSEVLRSVAGLATVTVLVARDDEGTNGYVFAQRGTAQIGPLVARSDVTADRLIAAARVHVDGPLRLNAVAANAAIAELSRSHRFVFNRRLTHMVRGTPGPARRDHLYGRINLGQG